MKSIIFYILLISPLLVLGQITIGERSIPSANDTIWMLSDNMPVIDLENQGDDQFWDFSSLSSGFGNKNILSKNSPKIIRPGINYDFFFEEEQNIIKFYRNIKGDLYEVGQQRPHPLNSDYVSYFPYQEPKLVRYGQLKFRDDKSTNSLLYLTLPGNEIPSLIQKKLPVTADSLRVKIDEIQDILVDAWGTLRLSYQNYDVLRQYQQLTTFTSVEIFSAGKWSPINSFVLDPKGELLGENKVYFFNFLSNTSKVPVARVKVNSSLKAISAEFKASDEIRNLVNVENGQTEHILSPNPSYGNVKLELLNCEYGTYKFEIYNIIGKKLWGEDLMINRPFTSYKYNFSFLGKGTYLWALTDKQGVRIVTKRMVIITP